MPAKLEASAQNRLGLAPLPFMAKQTGLLEVIFKMTVKNAMGGSSGCLPVAVHMSLFLLMKTILIAKLTSLWTQKPFSYNLFGAAELSRFWTQLLTSAFLIKGRLHWQLRPLLALFCHCIWDTYQVPRHSCLISPHTIYHRSPKSGGAALISTALTGRVDTILASRDAINRGLGLRTLL